MNKNTIFATSIAMLFALACCTGGSKPSPEDRTYETSFNSNTTATDTVADDPYINNSLSTGTVPYTCDNTYGDQSTITVKTSGSSNCDVVVMLKSKGLLVGNAYIEAGDSYTFDLPNGAYQVFFYGGRGWNPNKPMPNGELGGFVANESYSKDDVVTLDYEGLEYSLIPQQNGNFSTRQSSASEIF